MFIRPITIKKNGKRHAYWALVESYRTSCGPRQRIVSYLAQKYGGVYVELRNIKRYYCKNLG